MGWFSSPWFSITWFFFLTTHSILSPAQYIKSFVWNSCISPWRACFSSGLLLTLWHRTSSPAGLRGSRLSFRSGALPPLEAQFQSQSWIWVWRRPVLLPPDWDPVCVSPEPCTQLPRAVQTPRPCRWPSVSASGSRNSGLTCILFPGILDSR